MYGGTTDQVLFDLLITGVLPLRLKRIKWVLFLQNDILIPPTWSNCTM